MKMDALGFVKRCGKCQIHATVQHVPSTELTPLSNPWPFAQWGIDLMGPFPPASGQRKSVVVAIDYFTKWVEAKALAKTTAADIKDFLWKQVICRFGLPRVIISDGGPPFKSVQFKEFLSDMNIQHRIVSVAYPQSNGQTEVTNRIIKQGLKKRLDERKGRWAEELDHVLWAYRTTPRVTTGESPFSLTFGTEAMIPICVGLPTYRTETFDSVDNNIILRGELDLIEEKRDAAQLRVSCYQQKVAKYYNSKVRGRQFKVGDLVLRNSVTSDPHNVRKLSPNWEGPY